MTALLKLLAVRKTGRAPQFWKEFTETIKTAGYIRTKTVDPTGPGRRAYVPITLLRFRTGTLG
jgi:hypothetical protein